MRRSSNGRAVPLQGTDRGSIPLRRTKCPRGQIGKVASLKQRSMICLFESDRGYQLADVAQSVAHILGKDEVMGSIPVISTNQQVWRNR